AVPTGTSGPVPSSGAAPATVAPKGAQIRRARKDVQRLEREIDRISQREAELHEAMVVSASDHEKLTVLASELDALVARRQRAETDWLAAATLLED
ncbi:MAG: ABC transporter ATP-binding protein, partial [Solirubrobacteraceae bacterium]